MQQTSPAALVVNAAQTRDATMEKEFSEIIWMPARRESERHVHELASNYSTHILYESNSIVHGFMPEQRKFGVHAATVLNGCKIQYEKSSVLPAITSKDVKRNA